MSKKAFKSQASSSRAGTSSPFPAAGFGSPASKALAGGFGGIPVSQLSYVYEPPDLVAIDDSTAVVCLKNVQKRDSRTKAKALDELSALVQGAAANDWAVNDAFLEAWSMLYPRVSIDNARRVRQGAHALQGQISTAAGKRVAKYMPNVIGAWLCGMNDNDKLVVRSAVTAFQALFSTPEKQKAAWKAYQVPVLRYCSDIITSETVGSLSDLRTTSKDDAEAKYARVLGSALATLVELQGNIPSEEIVKQEEQWQSLLHNNIVWKNCASDDAFVRRSMYKLLSTVARQTPKLLDPAQISQPMIYEATKSDLTGSARDYLEALKQLTVVYPELWTSLYSGTTKKSAHRGLCHLLRQGGSAAGFQEYWESMSGLLMAVPESIILPKKEDDREAYPGAEVLKEMVHGISRRENRRSEDVHAWFAYLNLVRRIISLSDSARSVGFCTSFVLPLLHQYFQPTEETARWTITSLSVPLTINIFSLATEVSVGALNESLKAISAEFVQKLQISLPEQSKDYIKSQEAILNNVKSWYFRLRSGLQQLMGGSKECITIFLRQERQAAQEILISRNGKPYGASGILALQCSMLHQLTIEEPDTLQELTDFAQMHIPKLMNTPSAKWLLRLLDDLSKHTDIDSVYQQALATLNDAADNAAMTRVLEEILGQEWPYNIHARSAIKKILEKRLDSSLSGNSESWNLVRRSLRNSSTPADVTDDIISALANSLSINEKSAGGLDGLDVVFQENAKALQAYMLSDKGSSLVSSLLFLSQSPDRSDVRDHAGKLKSSTDKLLSGGETSTEARSAMVDIVISRLIETSPAAISTSALVAELAGIFVQTPPDTRPELVKKMVLDKATQDSILESHAFTKLDISLSLTNALQGAVFIVSSLEPSIDQAHYKFDHNGFSLLLRVANYYLELVHGAWFDPAEIFELLSEESRVQIAQFLALTNQLVADQINIPSLGGLWKAQLQSEESETDTLKAVVEFQTKLSQWLSEIADSRPNFYQPLVKLLFDHTGGKSQLSYYQARAYASLVGEEQDRHGGDSAVQNEEYLGNIRRSPDILRSTAYLSTVPESEAALRVCSELMSDLSGIDIVKEPKQGLEKMVLLNTIFRTLEDRKEDLPQQRLIFFIKHLLPYLEKPETDQFLLTEMFKTLNHILPLVKDLYGEFWSEIIAAIVKHLPAAKSEIPTLHAMLRLLGALRLLSEHDASEDLQESWAEQKDSLEISMVQLLMLQAELDDSGHQPLNMVNELLTRQLIKGQLNFQGSIVDLYPVLASPSTSLQRAAYNIILSHLPKQQEQASLDAALSKNYNINLPDELLSLILEMPGPDIFLGLEDSADTPAHILRYLLSWKIIFAHWEGASYAMQSAYVDILKDSSYLPSLLSTIFTVLISERPSNHPVDPSKNGPIETYTPSTSSDPQTETYRLLTHLYYLSLLHVPGLAKNWWRNDCPRALEKKVEAWTEKHISPAVIAAELATVSAWEPNPDTTTALEVRVSARAHEVLALYPIDEQHMAIRVVLPASYPLHPAAVTTQLRVGVDEKKWASWLNTSAIQINFASSSQGRGCVVDGLVAWRRNVAGALKGQSECAICYSVVSADRQLPSKKCGTCKNMFHGSCLFRWFRSSSSSSCPLCRNAFNYA